MLRQWGAHRFTAVRGLHDHAVPGCRAGILGTSGKRWSPSTNGGEQGGPSVRRGMLYPITASVPLDSGKRCAKVPRNPLTGTFQAAGCKMSVSRATQIHDIPLHKLKITTSKEILAYSR